MTEPTRLSATAFDREPVAILLTSLATVVGGGIAIANAWDWVDLTNEQTLAVMGFVAIITGVVGTVLRSRVYSPATVAGLTAP